MANPLDWAARAILQLNGMSPDQIKAKARQIKKQGPKKPMPKANTSAPQPERKAPVTRRTRVQGRVRPSAVTRSSQAGQPKPVRQGPRTANVKQQVDIGPRSAQKPDGPIGPNSRYTPKSKQQPDGKAPSKNVRKLQEAARTKPKSAAPRPAVKPPAAKPTARDLMPNSKAKGINLPQAANNVPPNQGPTLRGTKPGARAVPQPTPTRPSARDLMPNSRAKGINLPNAANNVRGAEGPTLRGGSRTAPKPPAAKPKPPTNARDLMPNSRAKGINLPNAANNVRGAQGPNLRGTKPTARTAPKPPATQPVAPKVNAGDAAAARAVRATNLGRRLSIGRGGLAQVALELANVADDSRLTPAQKAKKYEVVDPNRKDRIVDNLLSGGPRAKDTPKPKPATSKDAKAVQTKTYQRPQAQVNKPSSNKQATDKRDKKKLF